MNEENQTPVSQPAQDTSMPQTPPAQTQQPIGKGGYGNNKMKMILMYLVVGGLLYLAVWYFFLQGGNSGY